MNIVLLSCAIIIVILVYLFNRKKIPLLKNGIKKIISSLCAIIIVSFVLLLHHTDMVYKYACTVNSLVRNVDFIKNYHEQNGMFPENLPVYLRQNERPINDQWGNSITFENNETNLTLISHGANRRTWMRKFNSDIIVSWDVGNTNFNVISENIRP